MRRFQIFAVAAVLIATTIAFIAMQELSRQEDPPTQTDRMWTKGWPRMYRRAGGFGSIDHWDRAAYMADLRYFYGPALIVSAGIALVSPIRGTYLWLRARRRMRLGRCVVCDYDLSGVSGKCPECGRDA